MKSNKFLLTFILAAAMTGCINDADVTAEGGSQTGPISKGGNLDVVITVPNSSNGVRDAEDSGVYDKGSADEYKVTKVTLYLFDSSSKNLVYTFPITSGELAAEGTKGESDKEQKTIVYSCNKEFLLKPGTYDILAVANSSATFGGGEESTLLAQIDGATYGNGLITSVPGEGFIMSNRGSANRGIVIESPEKSDTKAHATIKLERAVAKLIVENKAEKYELKNSNGVTYATVRLNNYKFVNLANKFYTFRHVATLETASETPSAPSYSIAGGNFGDIASTNGYLIDPYFFDKTVAAAPNFTGGSFYTNHLSNHQNISWSGLASVGEWISIYCLENCMFRPAQYTVYNTGIMLKGTFSPAPSQTFNESGNAVEEVLSYNRLYYFNYKFYTTLQAVHTVGHANIEGLTEDSDDAQLEAKQIMRFTKSDDGNFSTYYNYWIKHVDNGNPTTMGVMEFGIVRNNIYKVNITNIKNLGPGKPDDTPIPSEWNAYLDVDFDVYPWIVRDQNASLDK